jgi:single-stranded DNA-specific DHH superfamily exonuclease
VRALLAESKLRFRLVARDVAFSLAPMLNAPAASAPPRRRSSCC